MLPQRSKPIVALVGRPNVGKSTLFNRLTGKRLAIVERHPGTTRDRLYADVEWGGRVFTLVDTGGLVEMPQDAITLRVRAQAELAIAEADVVVFLVDTPDGVLPPDMAVADILRRSHKPVVLAANKAEGPRRQNEVAAFYQMGLGDPIPISALHGQGTGDLLDAIVALLPAPAEEVVEEETIPIAIVGRPNVGKSSLLNAILGEERAIVDQAPGTTRDAIDTSLSWGQDTLTLIDTAGIRRRGRVRPGLERYGVLRALRAISRADVALLVLDATEGVTAQDAHIAGYILEEARGVALVVNKWDLVAKESDTQRQYVLWIREAVPFLSYAPILFVSALTGERVRETVEVALEIYHARRHRIPTGELNRLIRRAVERHAPPSRRGRRPRIYYATQAAVAPPTFVFFVNDPNRLHLSYRRYLGNRIREDYPFPGTPLRLTFRRREQES